MHGEWIKTPDQGCVVVFVAGVSTGGRASRSWRNNNGTHWPELLHSEPALETAGIHVCDEMSANGEFEREVTERVSALVALTADASIRSLVFVCHGAGGIVVRKFLVDCREALSARGVKLGLYLVAAPVLGDAYADWFEALGRLTGSRLSVGDCTWIKTLDRQFLALLSGGGVDLSGQALIEERLGAHKRFWREQVIEARPGIPVFGEPIRIPATDHLAIACPADRQSLQHRLLVQFIEPRFTSARSDLAAAAPVAAPALPTAHSDPALPASGNGEGPRIFISYRHTQPDEGIAVALERALIGAGCRTFLDRRMKLGTDWAAEIDQQIRNSDYFVVLLSAESIRSDMVRQEIMLAHQLKTQGSLQILPIRVAFDGALPYDLGGYLNPLQYAVWQGEQSTDEIASAVLGVVGRQRDLPQTGRREDESDSPAAIEALHEATEERGAPLPQVDPRVLTYAMERGTMSAESPFYLCRPSDQEMDLQLRHDGTTIIVKGSRQMGKSSMLVRSAVQARQAGKRVCSIDFQAIDESRMATLDSLLLYLMNRLARDLKTTRKVADSWDDALGPKDSATDFIEDAVLDEQPSSVILFLDEADRVFQFPYRNDFFALLRYWTTRRAYEPNWERFSLVVAHSTDPVLWIDDITQSPFNVGNAIRLADFDRAQLAELSRRYALDLPEERLDGLYELLGGQPYLSRQGLYVLASTDWDELHRTAARSDGPFGDHLRRLASIVGQRDGLRQTVLRLTQEKTCDDEASYQRLYAAGLVTGESRHDARLRCRLYADYFKAHL